jgi:glyoxylase-like metal-dependent hydrolase (beta-lactamase superfamily II)
MCSAANSKKDHSDANDIHAMADDGDRRPADGTGGCAGRREMNRWRTAVAAVALAVLAGASPHAAVASAPAVGGQSPGYYRMYVGLFEVTALLDGTHPFPSDRVALNAKPGEVDTLLRAQFLPSPFEGMINAFLVNMGSRLVLIDTGAGDLYGKDGGGLGAAIRAAGYTPDHVDDIFITHLHEDHAGGLLRDGKPVFANAVVHVSKRDADFWLDDRNQASVDDLLKTFFPAIQKVVEPYRTAGRFKPFADGAPLLPGLTAIAAPGHTPGHTFYLVQDGGASMLFWGDTVPMQPVQLPAPEIAIRYDWNVAVAVASRKAILAKVAANGWWVAGAHISFPGIGHVRGDGPGRYQWVPANYTLNRSSR